MSMIVAAGSGDEDRMFSAIAELMPFRNSLVIEFARDEQNDDYFDYVGAVTARLSGGRTERLTTDDRKNPESARRKVREADMIYVCGGNTLRLMKRLRASGIDHMLEEAYREENKILCGSSAGGICWFSEGCADSVCFARDPGRKVRVKALGLLPLLYAPHLIGDGRRKGELIRMVTETPGTVGVGFEQSALVIRNGVYRTLSLGDDPVAVRVCCGPDGVEERSILSDDFEPIGALLGG